MILVLAEVVRNIKNAADPYDVSIKNCHFKCLAGIALILYNF
jgi:hypothetical protein